MKKSKIIAVSVLAVIFAVVVALTFTGTIEAIEPEIHKLLNPNAEMSEFMHSFTVFGDTILDIFLIAVSANRGFLPAALRWLGRPVLPVPVQEQALRVSCAFW